MKTLSCTECLKGETTRVKCENKWVKLKSYKGRLSRKGEARYKVTFTLDFLKG